MKKISIVIAVFLGSSHLVNAAEQPLILGVLEEREDVGEKETTYSNAIRVVFYKDGNDWKAYDTDKPTDDCYNDDAEVCYKVHRTKYPSTINWTIGFNGKALGQWSAKSPDELLPFDMEGQIITTQTPMPVIGERSKEYGGFILSNIHRPLMASTKSDFSDPDGWKKAPLSPALVKIAKAAFRQKFPSADKCPNPGDEQVRTKWAYKDRDIHIEKSYASARHWALVQLVLGPDSCNDFVQDKGPFNDQWFAISPSNEIIYLDAGMWLVDTGDYDNDGKSEVIFSINNYNEGGYELFYDDFKKDAWYSFGYQ